MKHCVVEWLITGIEASVGAATLVEPVLTEDTAPSPFLKWWQEETSIRDCIVDLQAHQSGFSRYKGRPLSCQTSFPTSGVTVAPLA
jgi:hypothetical protein